MTLDQRVVVALDARAIAHALIGAAALAAAGVARSTLDLDLLTIDSRVLDPVAWQPFLAEGVDVEIRRGDHDDPLAGVVRLSLAGERPVDIILGRHGWQGRAVDRARRLPSGARVVQARDLVLLKLYAGGTQDLWDIRQLLAAQDGASLAAEVEADLGDLPPDARRLWVAAQRPDATG
jgi:hypothetical protein